MGGQSSWICQTFITSTNTSYEDASGNWLGNKWSESNGNQGEFYSATYDGSKTLTEAVGFDLDGDDQSKPLTDGLLLIRYLFGFSGDSLISGAIGDGAERDTAEEVEAYINERIPAE